MSLVAEKVRIKKLGRVDYEPTLRAMRDFTVRRTEETEDEIWLLEHPPVYTLGQGAPASTVQNGIPVLRSDRGGEITYHGPGQIVLYALVDLARRAIKVKRFVWLLEQAVIGAASAGRARLGFTSAARRSRRSASACRAAAPITGLPSTSTWISRPSQPSTLAAIPVLQ